MNITDLTNLRFSLFPIKHDNIYKLYKQCVNMFWVVEEVDLEQDIKDYNNKLNDNEKYYISNVLSFFAASDMIVMENLAMNFLKEVNIPECRLFFSNQIFMESIHSEMYNILIDVLISEKIQKLKLFNGIENNKTIKNKKEFCMKYINHDNFFYRLIAFICVEGIFFCSSFASIFYFKKRNLLPGVCFSNELISRDESQHVRHLILIFELIKELITEEEILKIFVEAVNLEIEFVKDSLPVDLIGINKDLMAEYVMFCGDRILQEMKIKKYFNKKNPFDWMDMI